MLDLSLGFSTVAPPLLLKGKFDKGFNLAQDPPPILQSLQLVPVPRDVGIKLVPICFLGWHAYSQISCRFGMALGYSIWLRVSHADHA
jgi:hypothetical protein